VLESVKDVLSRSKKVILCFMGSCAASLSFLVGRREELLPTPVINYFKAFFASGSIPFVSFFAFFPYNSYWAHF